MQAPKNLNSIFMSETHSPAKNKDINSAILKKTDKNITFIIFLESTKLKVVWIKITFFKQRVSITL